jgi:hypothetical protein
MSEHLVLAHPYEDNLEYQRVRRFQECLGGVSVKKIETKVDISAKLPSESASEDFLSFEVQYDSTFYAQPDMYEYFKAGIDHFEPFVSRGGKASRHGVFFGALVVGDGDEEVQVAVKPHARTEDTYVGKKEADRSCLKDYFVNVAAIECGFTTLTPVGVLLNSENDAYSFTTLDTGLTSLEAIRWPKFYKPEIELVDGSGIWSKMSMQTAIVHDTGDSHHGDLAGRNAAIHLFGQLMLIDLEDGNFTLHESHDIEERFGNSLVDLRKLMDSMATPKKAPNPGLGLFDRMKTNWWPAYHKLFFEEYAQIRLDMAAQGSHHMKKLKETKQEVRQLELSMKNHLEYIQTTYEGLLN